MSFIEIENISKKFKDVDVLKNINIEIVEGSVLGFCGAVAAYMVASGTGVGLTLITYVKGPLR